MVAISLYRGNLHRVPDVPRRWLMPNHTISMKDFRCLLHRRSRALSRSPSATTSNPRVVPESDPPGDAANRAGPSVERELENPAAGDCREGTSKGVGPEEVKNADEDPRGLGGGGSPEKAANDKPGAQGKDSAAVDCSGAAQFQSLEKPEEPVKQTAELTEKVDVLGDKEKRKKEVEEKLQVLNTKKHDLVQVLKQILNAEEELKRRSMQGMAMRPSVPLQVDVTNDSGSMTRHPTPRAGPEGNQGGDVEGGEAEDPSNHNIQSRPLLRMSSMSPSSESPLRRPALSQLNSVLHLGENEKWIEKVPHSSRAGLAVSGSPSRFAPQGNPPNLPPAVSLSGTNYIASSPSPAASGGTSAFKDARQLSPWS
ncbi:uncharacterized protein LOC116215595 isoform X1 [Punica granatum]|uniref:Uncharacterized protein LOC116215595 isoform X1 n=1 Tax=Punica granatum TaxID=22663 RepID=A0A6P8ELI3_PUNGR|nr:uncharacterized protein LOC116215595 isoform X1 [Punica granatum]